MKSADRDLDRKFWVALAMFAVLAVVVWLTMGDGTVLVFGKPVELKLVPLIVIGGMALRTVLARQAEKIRRDGEKATRNFQLRAASCGSNCGSRADVAQLVEHSLGKGEVTGSNPVISSRNQFQAGVTQW